MAYDSDHSQINEPEQIKEMPVLLSTPTHKAQDQIGSQEAHPVSPSPHHLSFAEPTPTTCSQSKQAQEAKEDFTLE